MTTEDLLEGVKAVDKRDGDVSASLTVENVYPNEKGMKSQLFMLQRITVTM